MKKIISLALLLLVGAVSELTSGPPHSRKKSDVGRKFNIELGSYPNIYKILREYTARSIKCSGPASQLLYAVNIRDKKEKIEVVVLSPADLGFPRGTSFDSLCLRAKARGYVECPMEAALHLRLLIHDQPIDEVIMVVSEPLTYDGKRNYFALGHLQTENGNATSQLSLGLAQVGHFGHEKNGKPMLDFAHSELLAFMKK